MEPSDVFVLNHYFPLDVHKIVQVYEMSPIAHWTFEHMCSSIVILLSTAEIRYVLQT